MFHTGRQKKEMRKSLMFTRGKVNPERPTKAQSEEEESSGGGASGVTEPEMSHLRGSQGCSSQCGLRVTRYG